MPIDDRQQSWSDYRLGEKMDHAIARLRIQECYLLRCMEGVFPERENDLQGFTRILDVASGTGIWAVQVAQDNPAAEVCGIEWYPELVRYASEQAKQQHVPNASFTLATEGILHLPFPDASFDLVNAHFLFTFVQATDWAAFVQECLRIIKPGGYLRLVEPEWEKTQSAAFEQLKYSFLQALKLRGHHVALDGTHIGLAWLLSTFLEQAGATQIGQRSSVCSYWSASRQTGDARQWITTMSKSIRPLLLGQGLISPMDFTSLTERLGEEIGYHGFSEMAYVLSACGRKPGCAR